MTLLQYAKRIETTLAHLPLVAARVNDDRCDAACAAAAEGLRDLIAVIAGVMIERAIEEEDNA